MNRLEICSDYNRFKQVFLEQNSRLNLISKNDEKYLYEKHFYDSLCIKYFFDKYDYIPKTVLDIGTGGGFPSVPLAMEYSEVDVYGIDSIRKKIDAVEAIKKELGLSNLTLINDRVENLRDMKFNLVVSRAVGKIEKLVEYAVPLLSDDGFIVLYKSKTANDEMDSAINVIRKYRLKIEQSISYNLPLEENFVRTLIVLKK